MIRKSFITIILLCFSAAAFSQQDPMYSQYVFNGMLINPAYAGTHEVLNASMLYRDQWVSVPGAPRTGILSLDAPIRNDKVGLGLNVSFDKIGVTSHTEISAVYSYKIRFSESTLSFGLQGGLGFSSSNFTSVKYSDNTTPDAAFQNNFNEALPNVGFGMYYFTDRFYAGLSVPQIGGFAIERALNRNAEAAHLDLANHYFISSGYTFDLSPDLKLKPSVLLKYVKGAPIEADVNAIVQCYDLLALGVSYRSLSSINFLAQVRLTQQLYIGYAYEYVTSSINNFSSGSHEIMLQYYFDFTKSKIITPRFF